MLLNCGVGELESPLDCQEIQPDHRKGDQSWVFIGGTDVEAGTPILWPPDAKSWLIGKDPDAGKDWGQEETDRGWDGWMASLTRWTWVWVDSGSWWWTGRPGVLQFMGSQRIGHDWVTDLNRWLSSKESAWQCMRLRRHEFNPCVWKIPWRRKWQPSPVSSPGKSQEQRSPWQAVYSPQGRKETDSSEYEHACPCFVFCHYNSFFFLVIKIKCHPSY